MTSNTEDLDIQTQIMECVDTSLKKLGQSTSQVIYFHMEKNFGIKKEDIPNQPKTFSKALHSIFGRGANVIESLIVHEIQEKFKLNLDLQTSITKAVETAKTKSRKSRLKQKSTHSESLKIADRQLNGRIKALFEGVVTGTRLGILRMKLL